MYYKGFYGKGGDSFILVRQLSNNGELPFEDTEFILDIEVKAEANTYQKTRCVISRATLRKLIPVLSEAVESESEFIW